MKIIIVKKNLIYNMHNIYYSQENHPIYISPIVKLINR